MIIRRAEQRKADKLLAAEVEAERQQRRADESRNRRASRKQIHEKKMATDTLWMRTHLESERAKSDSAVAAQVAKVLAEREAQVAQGLGPRELVLAGTFDTVHAVTQLTMQKLHRQVEATGRPGSLEYVKHISAAGAIILDDQFFRRKHPELTGTYQHGDFRKWEPAKFFRILAALNDWKLGSHEPVIQENTLVENIKKYLTNKLCPPTFNEPYQMNLATFYDQLQRAHPLDFAPLHAVNDITRRAEDRGQATSAHRFAKEFAKVVKSQCKEKYSNNLCAVEKAIKDSCLESLTEHPSHPTTHRDHFRLFREAAAKIQATMKDAAELGCVLGDNVTGPPWPDLLDPYAKTGKRRRKREEGESGESDAPSAEKPIRGRTRERKKKASYEKKRFKREEKEAARERPSADSDEAKPAEVPQVEKPLCSNCRKRHRGECNAPAFVERGPWREKALPVPDKGNGRKGADLSAYGPAKVQPDKPAPRQDPKDKKGKTFSPSRIPRTAHGLDTTLCVCEPCSKQKPLISNRVPVSLSIPQVQSKEGLATNARKKGTPKATATVSLIDTGAKGHDFISGKLADELVSHGAKIVPAKGRVKTALNGEETRVIDSAIVVNYNFMNEETKQLETITIEPVILAELRAPLIIGLDTIYEHGL
ncbi:MAG: hypothetical protein WCL08_10440, partial [Verrucomicrobiota bacterium]